MQSRRDFKRGRQRDLSLPLCLCLFARISRLRTTPRADHGSRVGGLTLMAARATSGSVARVPLVRFLVRPGGAVDQRGRRVAGQQAGGLQLREIVSRPVTPM